MQASSSALSGKRQVFEEMKKLGGFSPELFGFEVCDGFEGDY